MVGVCVYGVITGQLGSGCRQRMECGHAAFHAGRPLLTNGHHRDSINGFVAEYGARSYHNYHHIP